MKKKTGTLFASVVAAAAVTIGVASVASASSSHETGSTLHLVASGGQHSAQGGGPPALGSQDAFNELLADQTGHVIGHSGGTCTVVSFTAGQGEANCSITLVVPGGELLLGGLQPLSRGPFTLAVVGGTGRYDKATGEADITIRPDHNRDVTVHLN